MREEFVRPLQRDGGFVHGVVCVVAMASSLLYCAIARRNTLLAQVSLGRDDYELAARQLLHKLESSSKRQSSFDVGTCVCRAPALPCVPLIVCVQEHVPCA